MYGGGGLYGGGGWIAPFPAYVDPFYTGSVDPAYSDPGPGDPAFNQPAPSPTMIINPNYQPETAHPQIRDYSNVPLPQPGVTITPPEAAGAQPTPPAATAPRAADDDQPNIFLIALKDQSVLAAAAYWVQGDTLNYVTLNGEHNHVSLSAVDRDLSKRLNSERQVQFRLPGPR